MEPIQIGIEELLAIIERSARHVVAAMQNPQSLNTESLLKHIAREYAFAERLHELAQAARASAENGASEPAN